MARRRDKSAGHCVECGALVALRDDRSCPSCGFVDALRPLPRRLQIQRPRLSNSVLYTATKVSIYIALPAIAIALVHMSFPSAHGLFLYVFDLVASGVGFILGLLIGPALGAVLAHVPWLAAKLIDHGVLAPWRKLRLWRRVEPTFQRAFEKLAQGRDQLATQLTQMEHALRKVQETQASRDPSAAASRRRLAAAEQALIAGIQARRDGLEAIDAVVCEVNCQRLECEIAAVTLIARSDAGAATAGLAHLARIEAGLRGMAPSPGKDGPRSQVSQAIASVEEMLRSARERLHAIEDGRLLEQAAALVGDVKPVHEQPRMAPYVGSFQVPNMGTQLLRIDAAVTQCLGQRLRVEAEREAVAEVEALAEVDAPAREPRRSVRS